MAKPFKRVGPVLTEFADGDTVDSCLTPAAGVKAVYTDAATGDDAKSGSDWANAWKTHGRLVRGVSNLLQALPNGLEIRSFLRGSFGSSDHLYLNGLVTGSSTVALGCTYADSAVVATGTVFSIVVDTAKHGLVKAVLVGVSLGAADKGRWIRFDDGVGGHVANYQIVRVGSGTVWICDTTIPGWLAAGANVNVFESGWIIQGQVGITGTGIGYSGPGSYRPVAVFNARCYQTPFLNGSRGVVLAVDCRNVGGTNQPIYTIGCDHTRYLHCASSTSGSIPPAAAIAYGLTNAATYVVKAGVRASAWYVQGGYQSTLVAALTDSAWTEAGSATWWYSAADNWYGYGADKLMVKNCIASGVVTTPFEITSTGFAGIENVSILDLPAAGCARLFSAHANAVMNITNAECDNTAGSGSSLRSFFASRGGRIEILDGSLATCKSKHGQIFEDDGTVRVIGATTLGALPGGGPDIEGANGGEIRFEADFVKSAVNTAASKILKLSYGTKMEQDAAKVFTLPAGSGNHTTDYGAEGAIEIMDAEARLGPLTGGQGGSTGVACTLRHGGRLTHAGAGVSGTAPLKLGASAASAWPTAPDSELSEDCSISPGV